MGKTTEEIEAIRERLRSNPQTAALADTMMDPNGPEFAAFQEKGREQGRINRAAKKLRDARIAEKAAEMSETLEAIKLVAQSPQDVMTLLMHEAMESGDQDAAFKIAKELGEYKEPKKTRIEAINLDKTMEDLSKEELEELAALKGELKQ